MKIIENIMIFKCLLEICINMDKLPNEMIYMIISYLPNRHKKGVSRVCKLWWYLFKSFKLKSVEGLKCPLVMTIRDLNLAKIINENSKELVGEYRDCLVVPSNSHYGENIIICAASEIYHNMMQHMDIYVLIYDISNNTIKVSNIINIRDDNFEI